VATAARAFRAGLEWKLALRDELTQVTDGREAGTSAARSSGATLR